MGLDTDTKSLPLCPGAKSNLRALGEVEENSFIALPVKGGHCGSWLEILCASSWEYLVRSFIAVVQGWSCWQDEGMWRASSVQSWVMSNSLWLHGLQHARLPCLSPTPRVFSNSCPLSWWCHPTISSSVIPFSSCFQSFPASGSFPMSQFFASGCQGIGVSASSSCPSSENSGLISFRMDWFDLLAVQG